MRLTKQEVSSIKVACGEFINDIEPEIYLYGSRVDDKLKGGDIDLIWVVNDAVENSLNINKYKVLAKIKTLIGDQKIDLSIASREKISEDYFLTDAMRNAVQL